MKTQNFKGFEVLFFIIISAFWIFPPFFNEKAAAETVEAVYPVSVFINFAFSILIFFTFNDLKKKEKPNIFNTISEATITAGAIFLLSAFFYAVLYFGIFGVTEKARTVVFPSSSISKSFNCILGTFCAAFFEEILYRFYLPGQILAFLKEKAENKIVRFSVEISAVLIFGFSHLYLGILNTVFACISGIILRRGYLKTNNLFLMAAIHGIYNLLIILVSIS